MLVSCLVVAALATRMHFATCNWGQAGPLQIVLLTSIALVQTLAPLAIGWWFIRREHDRREMQLAA